MKYLFFVIASLTALQSGFSQDVLNKQDILPPSPEAAAFIKNVNIPVSYSSGTPQISIPFRSIKSGGLEVPVAISYNASGIRVEEVPTWVGLGWNLSAGGQITRAVRSLPDESQPQGYMIVPNNRKAKYVDVVHCRCNNQTTEGGQMEDELNIYHTLDVEPDQYTFSVMGYSGDFFYNQDSGKFILVPNQNIKIEGSPIVGYFILTLPNGVKSYFGNNETSKEVLLSGTTSSYIDGYSYAPVALSNVPYTTSWLLTTLTDPVGRSIDLTYTNETIISFGRGGERYGHSIADGNGEPTSHQTRQSFYKQYIKKPVLQKIAGESGNIYFKTSSVSRLDMPAYNGSSKSLDTIMVTDANNQELTSYYFDYGYFLSPDYPLNGILDIAAYAEEAKRRLYLKSVTEKKGSTSLPPYEFTYSDIALPSRFSTAQDYWGYYNAKNNGTSLLPRIPALSFNPVQPTYNEDNHILPRYGAYYNYNGADRRIDTNYIQGRILKKIKYTTGGTTEYFYEANEAATQYNLNIYGGMEPPDMIGRSFTLNFLSNPVPVDPPYPLVYSGTFHINIPTTLVKIIPQLTTCGLYNDPSCVFTVRVKKLPEETLITEFSQTATLNLPLTTGDYLAEITFNGSSNEYPPFFQLDFQWGERLNSLSFTAGGLRIKKIISDAQQGKITRSFKYNNEQTGASSGTLAGIPTYKVHEIIPTTNILRQYYVSNSALPLTDEGKTVRYEFVSEFFDTTASSFKTNYTFTSGLSDPLKLFAGAQTGAPIRNWNWQNNLLKQKEVFEKTTSGAYRTLLKEENFYQFFEPISDLYGLYGPQIIAYEIPTEWYLPDSVSTTSYSYVNGIATSTQSGVKHLYNSKYLQAITRTTNSTGQKFHSKTWYPSDYNDVAGFNINTLLSKGILSVPIKAEVSINGKIRSGNIIKYNSNGQPVEGYNYEGPTLADTVVHDRNIVLESNYQLLTSLRYDIDANIKQVTNYKTGATTYIWDYQINGYTGAHMNMMPVAMVQNADSNSVAYTSFEEAGTGNWALTGSATVDNTTLMGNKCFYFSGGNISKGGLSTANTYIVSYWSKNGSYSLTGNPVAKQGRTVNGWTYYEHQVTGITSVTITGTGYIDELRLYPKNALMTTFSYKYSIGVSSQCDPNNRITYYEYDNFNRLSFVRDLDKNIIKKICYNYSGQPVDCGYGTLPAWQASSSTCENTAGVNTGNMILIEKDMNPLSTTYNQTRSSVIQSGGSCPVCNTTICTGLDKKCINNVCETGIKVYTGSVTYGPRSSGQWKCYFHYFWSDYTSSPTYEEINNAPCSF